MSLIHRAFENRSTMEYREVKVNSGIFDFILGALCYSLLASAVFPSCAEGKRWVVEEISDCLASEKHRLCDMRNVTVGMIKSGKLAILGRGSYHLDRIGLLSIELTRCASKQEPETCMFFTTAKYTDACEKLNLKNEIWSSYFGNTDPPMKCPLKGTYGFEKSFVDLSKGKGVAGLEGFYWKIKVEVMEAMKPVCCLKLEASMASD